jgi:CheY-like chemotaxis protein/HPt (histidine-containing phosphotransfer) domain-containing protein
MMPAMDGFTLAEQILQYPALAGATLMMISSAGRREDAERCRALGVSAYMTKPIRRAELMTAILNSLSPEDAAARTRLRSPRSSPDQCRRSLHVLLAEDNLVNQKLAVRLLEKRGHTAVVVGNGREAVARLAQEVFDVVLMDVQMPEMDGFEATSALRQAERASGRHTPVVAMTAHAMKGDRERCLEAGMDDYVSKPLRPEELFETIERLAEAQAPAGVVAPAPDSAVASAAATSAETFHPAASAMEQVADMDEERPTFDPSHALNLVGGDEQLLRELLEIFMQEAPALMRQIDEGIANRDSALVKRAAHTLKGAVGNFGVRAVFDVCHRLEMMGKAGDLADAESAYLRLRTLMERLEPELAALVRQPAPVSS